MPDLKAFARAYLADRQRARTDLPFLCREVLEMRDLVPHAHGPIVDSLQQFYGANEVIDNETLRIVQSEPKVPLWDLEGPRNHLLLYPRGHLKTSINTVAHSIQWILNYPNVRILVTTATEDLAKEIMQLIQAQFTVNERMKFLFPEFCGKQLGNSEQFTVPNRTNTALKEPTMSIITVTSSMAGHHFEVIKHSDVIDINNSRTAGGLDTTRHHFRMCIPLLEPGPSTDGKPSWGWRTVEGTIYSYADYHAEWLEKLQKDPKLVETGQWRLTHRSCWTDDAKTAPIWPERFSVEMLKQIQDEMGPELFANQYELNPLAEGAGLTTPERLESLFMPRNVIDTLLPRMRLHVTIDLAGLEQQSTGDYTVITLCGFDRSGRMYVVDCFRGHYEGYEVIEIMFRLDKRYPILDFKIEKDAHARGLRSALEREQSQRGRFLNIVYLPKDTHVAKVDRIKHGLGYWFRMGIIRFADDLVVREALTDEVLRFPKWKHDDILDTLVDQTHNQNSTEPDILSKSKPEPPTPFRMPKFRGFGIDGQPLWGGEQSDLSGHYDRHTGI